MARPQASSKQFFSLFYRLHRPQYHLSSPHPTTRTITTSRPKSSTERTHYTLFPQTLPRGQPPAGPFGIDTAALRKEFIQLQSLYHPDRQASEPDKKKAEGTSALINEAYRTLLDPLKRAQYLLQLRGIDVAEDERLKTEDLDLLETVMELRVEIESAQEESDLEELNKENEKRIEKSVASIQEAFERDDLDAAKEEAVRLRYWVNVRESVDGWEKGKPIVLVH